MAAQQEPTVSLKIFVDREKNRVLLAESDRHFVDILFSFLTLPSGTIIRLVGKESTTGPPVKLGSMNNLYESVEKLGSDESMLTEIRKNMLLRPSNIWAAHLKKLKLNVDDSGSAKFFICSNIKCSRRCEGGLLSNYVNASCSCGNLMDTEIKFEHEEDYEEDCEEDCEEDYEEDCEEDCEEECNFDNHQDGNGEVFVNSRVDKFVITDDLKVMHCAPSTSIKLLNILAFGDVKKLEERTLNLGLKDIVNILKRSLISSTPLTDVFLAVQESSLNNVLQCYCHKYETSSSDEMIPMRVYTRKSDNRVVYVEAREDFVDFLFSLLTVPLGNVISQLDGTPDLGCINNLHNSVLEMNDEWFVELKQEMQGLHIDFQDTKTLLLCSGVAPQVSCRSQVLNIREEVPIQYYCYSEVYLNDDVCYYLTESDYKPKKKEYGVSVSVSPLTLIDPKTPAGGFVSRPAMFMVSDDLKVTPLSSYSVSSLKTLEFPISDLEECRVCIGELEALCLLKASLISTSPLTDVMNIIRKKPCKKIDIWGKVHN